MTTDRIKRIHLIYGIVLSILLVTAGFCLINGCLSIYHSGSQPFSREAVAEAFHPIRIPVSLCLLMIVGGFLLNLVLPLPSSRPIGGREEALTLKRLHSKTDLNKCDQSLRNSILAQQRLRKTLNLITLIVTAAGSVIFLIYALNGSHFHASQINDSMIRAMMVLLPCMAVPFAWAVFAAYRCRSSIHREIELVKQISCSKEHIQEHDAADRRMLVRRIIFIVGIAFLVFGFISGGTTDVLTKAVNICTECVGLG